LGESKVRLISPRENKTDLKKAKTFVRAVEQLKKATTFKTYFSGPSIPSEKKRNENEVSSEFKFKAFNALFLSWNVVCM
jgi:hypothetical protein